MSVTERVAVVIVNANAGELLERTLSALARQSHPPARVVVVDNASTDGSAAGLEERHPGVEVVRLAENLGFAAANNLGIDLAAGCDWVGLLNPDAFPEPGWLEALLRAGREHPEYTFFGSRLLRAGAPGQLDGTGDVYHVSGLAWRRDHGRSANGVATEPAEIFSPCAAAALYRRDALQSVGGFDESFFCYFEDTDLSFRLRLAGHRCLYVPDAVAHHVGSAIAGSLSDFTVYHSFRNLVWTYVKNMPRPLFWLYLPQHVLVNLLTVVAFALRGQGHVILRSKRDALRGLPRILRERRAVQSRRTVGSRELWHTMRRGLVGYLVASARAGAVLRARRSEG